MAYTTIDDPSAHFQAVLWTGTGSSNAITFGGNSDLQPDYLWGKERTTSGNHNNFDSSRGLDKRLTADQTDAENTDSTTVTSFDSNGFTLGTSANINEDTVTTVGWCWKANGGSRTTFAESGDNPAGGYQANTTAGFSIIDYTGTGANGTVAHGLGVVPNLVIIKNRDSDGNSWFSHWTNLLTSDAYIMYVNNTDEEASNATGFNSTQPSSTVVTVGTNSGTNTNDDKYIGYVFASVQGYSKFGFYKGNGNADGPFIYTGFKPAFLLAKRANDSGDWILLDNARNPFNQTFLTLKPNSNAAEITSVYWIVDFLSNGFKPKLTDAELNGDGDTIIYMAFAEQPFVTSGGVPCTAR